MRVLGLKYVSKKKKDSLTYNTTNTYTEQEICASRAAELIVKTMCWVQRKRASKSEKEKKKKWVVHSKGFLPLNIPTLGHLGERNNPTLPFPLSDSDVF